MEIRKKNPAVSVCEFICVAAILSLSPSAFAQTAATPTSAGSEAAPPSYDVMSIRQNKSGGRLPGAYAGYDAHYSSINVSLKSVLAKIFNVKENLIFGIPNDIDSTRFDIEAKIVDPDPEAMKNMTREQERMMMLPLLSERFQLKTHIETRTMHVYDLVVTKGGPKFKQSADQTKRGGGIGGRGDNQNLTYTFHGMPVSSLTDLLTDRVQRTVIDKTGLAGYYDLTLSWGRNDTSEEQADSGPTIFTALQEQLGLKLESTTGPVQTLVVDHVEMPTEN